jgi:hypothetical protein
VLTNRICAEQSGHTVTAEKGYPVEFFDMTGNTVGVATLPATALRMPTPADRPAARALRA